MEYFTSTHRDNPKWVDQKTGEYTKAGRHYIEIVLGNLTGNRRRRLLEGVWCADESSVFDIDVLEEHDKVYARPPDFRLEFRHRLQGKERDVSLRARRLEDIQVKTRKPMALDAHDRQNCMYWWGELSSKLRPPQDRVYIIAADISSGNGASNSVITVRDRNTRQKVGEWVSGTISPRGMGRMMAMIGHWCGGRKGSAFAIWEANGPGQSTGKVLSRVLAYPLLYRRTLGGAEAFDTSSDRLGWWNDRQSLRDGVEALRDAYANEEILNPSEPAIQEAMQWVRFPGGGMGPGHLQDESQDAKATHGDRVVADMLSEIAMGIDIPTPEDSDPPVPPGFEGILDDNEDDDIYDEHNEIAY
jgi:hypothetical protein